MSAINLIEYIYICCRTYNIYKICIYIYTHIHFSPLSFHIYLQFYTNLATFLITITILYPGHSRIKIIEMSLINPFSLSPYFFNPLFLIQHISFSFMAFVSVLSSYKFLPNFACSLSEGHKFWILFLPPNSHMTLENNSHY